MEVENIFKKYQFKNGDSELLNFNSVSIRIKRKGQGWEIYSFDNNKEEPENGAFFQSDVSDSLILAPALPSKPLVFKGKGISVLPKARFHFFLKIPLVFQFYHTKKTEEHLITEISSVRLSDTWFGEPQDGEPAYALDNSYALELENLDLDYFEAVCPVSVINNSDKILELQRMIIRVENLGLYRVNNKIFTGLLKLEYKGKDTMSSASYVTSKAIHGEKPLVISKPRNEDKVSLKVNFDFIRNIYKSM